MEILLKGVEAFHEHYYQSRREMFETLAESQHPVALFVTCSDSRIDPNLLTQTKPGELFVLRNAGNIIPPYGASGGGECATVEYAVNALNIRDIIVCGHTNCGAMKALRQRELTEGLPAVAEWLAYAETALIEEGAAETHGDEASQLESLIEKNVLAQLANLRTHPAVAAHLAAGGLRLHGWVYRIRHGVVAVHDPTQSRFVTAQSAPDKGDIARQELKAAATK